MQFARRAKEPWERLQMSREAVPRDPHHPLMWKLRPMRRALRKHWRTRRICRVEKGAISAGSLSSDQYVSLCNPHNMSAQFDSNAFHVSLEQIVKLGFTRYWLLTAQSDTPFTGRTFTSLAWTLIWNLLLKSDMCTSGRLQRSVCFQNFISSTVVSVCISLSHFSFA